MSDTWANLVMMPLGDSALIIRLGDHIDPVVNRRVHALAGAVQAAHFTGVIEVCPAYTDLAVYFDPLYTGYEQLVRQIQTLRDQGERPDAGRIMEIPVRYGGADGPDLEEVARLLALTPDEVVNLHSGREYTVYMIGFLPGFPYMGIVPDELVVPRLATPRVRVPAGSVGLALRQTGIYPLDAPGGWRIIGRTDRVLFDPVRESPCLLAPGDRVRFVPI